MALRQKIRSTALRATAAIVFIEVTTHLPTEGRSSLTYHYLFDHVITPLGRRLFDPEGAHNLALEVVRRGLAPRLSREGSSCSSADYDTASRGSRGVVDMKVEIGKDTNNNNSGAVVRRRRLQFPGPIGLAAGFDKNGTAIPGLFDMGFSFVEIGSVTPLPQPGNARPRSFRLVEDRGVINRFGFNSEGVERVQEYLIGYRREFGGMGSASALQQQSNTDGEESINVAEEDVNVAENYGTSFLWALGWAWNQLMTSTPRTGVLGVNLGKNKTSDDEVEDYTVGIRDLGPYADYLVINVSSPNTPGLRSLQQREPLQHLLSSTLKAREEYAPHAPLFVKLAPDLSLEEMEDVAKVALETGIDGMIVSNTTNTRPESLLSKHKHESGGLSGAPIKDRSTECIRTMYKFTNGRIPIIGVGGVGSGRDAYDKLKAGASLIQVYSMMVYEGPGVVSRIRKELADILVENGYKSVEDVVGSDQEDIYWNRREERVRRRMQEREQTEKEIVDL
ncbi:hypothetical protein ACHAXR_006509 [Thalassiosira sp. AJA248-18]